MRFVDRSIRLLDCIPQDIAYKLWLRSRYNIIHDEDGDKLEYSDLEDEDSFYVGNELVDRESYKERIDRMNLQYNNFPQYVFQITGSCLFRDFLFNMNKFSAWAESNRFIFSTLDEDQIYNPDNYPISYEYKDNKDYEDQFKIYMDKIKSDPITDHNRVEMPYSLSSTFWIGLNYKSLLNIVSFMKLHIPEFYEWYGKDMIDRAEISEDKLLPYVDAGITQYINDQDSWTPEVKKFNDYYFINIEMGLILFSQFLRQSDTIISGFYNQLINGGVKKVFKGNTPIRVTFIAHKDKLLRTIQNRTCNFAQNSGEDICSWTHFIKPFVQEMIKSTDDFRKLLPCKFNTDGSFCSCKFHDDVKFRSEGIEKRNTICPLIDQDLELAKIKHARDNNILSQWYLKLTEELSKD